MAIYKPTYTDRNGKRKKTRKWYIEYRTADGRRRRVPGFQDKRATQQKAAELERQVEWEKSGAANPFADHCKTPLAEHLRDYREDLYNRGRSEKHILQTAKRIVAILDGCGFAMIRDLSAFRTEAWLADLRNGAGTVEEDACPTLAPDAPRTAKSHAGIARAFGVSRATVYYWERHGAPIEQGAKNNLEAIEEWRLARAHEVNQGTSARTRNYYLTAFKGFLNWMVKHRRMPDNPLAPLSGLGTEGDKRRLRRALADEELADLLKAAHAGPEFRGLSGFDREALYMVAAYTGLRASELASLTPESFDLTGKPYTVTVEAAYSKRRRLDTLPLRKDLVEWLAPWLRGKAPGTLLWPGTWRECAAKMVSLDMTAARQKWIADATTEAERKQRQESDRLKPKDAKGHVFDFHGFRHTFITNLVKSGAHPKAVQSLARHSTIKLTFDLYAHLGLLDLEGALDTLADVPAREPQGEILRATGTDDAVGRASWGPSCGRRGPKTAQDGTGRRREREEPRSGESR